MSAGDSRVTEAQVRGELLRMEARASRRRAAIGALIVLAAAIALGMLVSGRLFALVDVRGDAMAGTLQSGDVALCVRCEAPLLGKTAGRGSLALVRYSVNGIRRTTVRRVIALPGDVVSVDDDGYVTLNGQILDEPYASYRSRVDWEGGETVPGGALENPFAQTPTRPEPERTAEDLDDVTFPIKVPEGRVFVLCDNRENLMDSRSSRFSLVNEADILALAHAVLWPAYRIGAVG